jgi:hypothetical protein
MKCISIGHWFIKQNQNLLNVLIYPFYLLIF